jgi:hypothetical protein
LDFIHIARRPRVVAVARADAPSARADARATTIARVAIASSSSDVAVSSRRAATDDATSRDDGDGRGSNPRAHGPRERPEKDARPREAIEDCRLATPGRRRGAHAGAGTTRAMSPRNAVAVALLNDPNECVVVDLDALPTDVEDVASVLQAELAPLEAWIEVTEAYLRRGDARGFETLMEMVCAPGAWTRAPRPTGRDARANERTNERKRANVCAIER